MKQSSNETIGKILLSFAVTLVFVFIPMSFTHAEGFSLGVYPPLTHITALPGNTIKKDITILNYSNSPIRIKPSFVAFTSSQSNNGAVNYLPNDQAFSSFIKRARLSLEDETGLVLSEITLAPLVEKKVFLSFTLSPQEKESDYYFSVVFTSQPENEPLSPDSKNPQVSAVSLLQLGIATNILLVVSSPNLLSIGSTPVEKAPLLEASTSFFKEKGWVDFSLLVSNPNKNVQQARGVIIIKNMFNQAIGKVDLAPSYILSNSTRLLMDKESAQAKTQQDAEAIWREDFLLGFYSATISVSFDSQKSAKTIYFIAFPFKQIGALLLTLFAFKMVWKRIKKNI